MRRRASSRAGAVDGEGPPGASQRMAPIRGGGSRCRAPGLGAAQQWMYDLVRAHFPEPKAVAAATYNFACFYVRVARNDEALLRFRHAFELDPELKEVASKDSDLDRIRDHPELVELLAS